MAVRKILDEARLGTNSFPKFFPIFFGIILFQGFYFSGSYLLAQPPSWQAPPASNYSYSATMTAIITLDGENALHPDDRVAVFEDGQIAGLGTSLLLMGNNYHFITVYSNIPTGDTLDIFVYSADSNKVYKAFSTLPFQHLGNWGDFVNPFEIVVFSGSDAPIQLDSIPAQTSLQGYPLEPLLLNPYLISSDNDPVEWTFEPNNNLQVQIAGDTLLVTPDSAFSGTTTLTITATELTPNALKAEGTIAYQVDLRFDKPALDSIPYIFVRPGETFDTLNVAELQAGYGGDCLQWKAHPVLNKDTLTKPDWTAGGANFIYEMNLILQVGFTPEYMFNSPHDRLALLINGQIRAVVSPSFPTGSPIYLITIRNDQDTAAITGLFYSHELKRTFSLPGHFLFNRTNDLGSINNPFFLDFCPFLLDFTSSGELSFEIADTTFRGSQLFQVVASDCKFPKIVADTGIIWLSYDDDLDGDGYPNSLETDAGAYNPCIPNHAPGFTNYLAENPYWRAGDCDGDTHLNGLEDSLDIDPYLDVSLLQVYGKGQLVPPENTTFTESNLTSFGARKLMRVTEHVFTVRNNYSSSEPSMRTEGALTLTDLGDNARAVLVDGDTSMFTIRFMPRRQIFGINEESPLRIRYQPTAVGCHTATISIFYKYPENSSFTFRVRGWTEGSENDCPN